jgi:antitoxin (DNA-binding transcriptional repressor) of toxin-antitoxin stability system
MEKELSIIITLEEAQARLKDLIHQLEPGDEIIITENQHTVAKLVSEIPHPRKPRVPGLGKGMITLLVEDDEHLDGFSEYMS